MSRISVRIEGEEELNRLLDEMSGPELKRLAGKAVGDAAKKVLKPPVQAQARPLSRRLGSSIRAGAGKRDKPSGIVRRDPKRAWFGHFLIGGTRPHGRHPGIRATPIFDNVQHSHGDRAVDFVADQLKAHFDLD